jgi:hypothetical protein
MGPHQVVEAPHDAPQPLLERLRRAVAGRVGDRHRHARAVGDRLQ